MIEGIKKFWQSVKEKYEAFKQTEFAKKTGPVLKKTGAVLALTGRWAYKLRSILLAIPVGVTAIALAVRNAQQLPTEVGLSMQANGEYQWIIGRGAAVWIPLLITVVCLAMMFVSKKVLYPWLISLFSLALPLVLWLSNIFPN